MQPEGDALSPKPIYLFDLCTQKNIPHTQKHMLANVKSMVGVELRKYVGQMDCYRIKTKTRKNVPSFDFAEAEAPEAQEPVVDIGDWSLRYSKGGP